MVVTYRGHEIKVVREKCLGGWDLLYYSAFRIADGLFVVDGFPVDNINDIPNIVERNNIDLLILPVCYSSYNVLKFNPDLNLIPLKANKLHNLA